MKTTSQLAGVLLITCCTGSLAARALPGCPPMKREVPERNLSEIAILSHTSSRGDVLGRRALSILRRADIAAVDRNAVLAGVPAGVDNNTALNPTTVGATLLALQGALGELDAFLKSATGDIAAHLNTLLNDGNALLAQWEYRFRKDLDKTAEQLNKTERRIVENTETLIEMIRKTIYETEILAIGTAKVTAAEADILAYNVTSILRRNKEARFVYAAPSAIRMGRDEGIVSVRGNFLDFKPYTFRIENYDGEVMPVGYSANEVSLKMPEELLSRIKSKTTVALTAEPYNRRKHLLWFGYKYWRSSPKSVFVTVHPSLDYTIVVQVAPEANVPTKHTFSYSFYEIDDNCSANKKVNRTYTLPPPWTIADPTQRVKIRITSANCGSGLTGKGAYYSGNNSVVVEARIKGCGHSGPFKTFCKGRGWLRYVLQVPAISYQYQKLPVYQDTVAVSNGLQRTFTFDYPESNVPKVNDGVRYKYTVSLMIAEGTSVRKVELSDVNPNAEGIITRMDDGRLSLEIPAPLTLGRNESPLNSKSLVAAASPAD